MQSCRFLVAFPTRPCSTTRKPSEVTFKVSQCKCHCLFVFLGETTLYALRCRVLAFGQISTVSTDHSLQFKGICQKPSSLGIPSMPLCSPRFSWGFFLSHVSSSLTSVLKAHEIRSNQNPGCWETKKYCKVSVLMAQQSQLFRSSS